MVFSFAVPVRAAAVPEYTPVGKHPGRIVLKWQRPPEELYVANEDSGTISVIDTATRRVARTIPVGPKPTALALTPDGAQVFVGLSGGTIVVIDTDKERVTCSIDFSMFPPSRYGSGLSGLALAKAGRKLYVTIREVLTEVVLPPGGACPSETPRVVQQIGIPNQMAVAGPDFERLYLTVQGGPPGHDPIRVFDVNTNTELRPISQWPPSPVDNQQSPIANVGGALVASPDGAQVWVPASDACSNPRYDFEGCPSLGPREDISGRGVINIIDALEGELVNQLVFHSKDARDKKISLGVLDAAFSPSGEEIAVLTNSRVLFFDTRTLLQTGKTDRNDDYGGGGNLAYSHDGTRLYVTLSGKDSVQTIQLASQAPALIRFTLTRVSWAWAAHIAFWAGLLVLYPRSTKVQAIFFWNPVVRNIAGVGYIGAALTWIPFLRRVLLSPFRRSFLADARLEQYASERYFDGAMVRERASTSPTPIFEAIPHIRGRIILVGDSGLGKTTFIRHLLQHSNRTIVYLPATKCSSGVLEAIMDKLLGLARDPGFVQSLIYTGAIDVCIDGLNEADADTRARIVEFVERYFRGNILIATQPLQWTPPAGTQVYTLLPLDKKQVTEFLLTRYSASSDDVPMSRSAYESTCSSYVADALEPNQPRELLDAAQRVLSNPMDLTTVAHMLMRGKTPDLFHLPQQQYEIMAAEYAEDTSRMFPLAAFSDTVYEMRLANKLAMPEKDFVGELGEMEKHKMVVVRHYVGSGGAGMREWYFRQERISDFFVLQTFLGEGNDRPTRHLDDPRFRGVYFQLATVLPLDAAKTLREHLILYAARSKDHSVSDAFVELLQGRVPASV